MWTVEQCLHEASWSRTFYYMESHWQYAQRSSPGYNSLVPWVSWRPARQLQKINQDGTQSPSRLYYTSFVQTRTRKLEISFDMFYICKKWLNNSELNVKIFFDVWFFLFFILYSVLRGYFPKGLCPWGLCPFIHVNRALNGSLSCSCWVI